ncbi:hypothetical protein IMSHALPRED_003697 [Imshaugia aleurites]|uniref:AA1-like domain-containing protein n=1 Tax=Imshaugia aleurites TaxID=172621 RepID=A0A8H3PK66_9LECA|nr:hypothetical protein IMSHALPRED_003697 [Imshaugia aleurites]
MHVPTLSALLFAVSAFAAPVDHNDGLIARDADLVIRMWNTTTFDCNYDNPHIWAQVSPGVAAMGPGGFYDSYSLSRDLASNETLGLFSASGTNPCGNILYNITNLDAGCYETEGTSETFSCIQYV